MEEKKTSPGTPAWGTTKVGSTPSEASATEATPASENPYTQWYEVKKGDTLWKIAKDHYGDGSLYPEIFKANRNALTRAERRAIFEVVEDVALNVYSRESFDLD